MTEWLSWTELRFSISYSYFFSPFDLVWPERSELKFPIVNKFFFLLVYPLITWYISSHKCYIFTVNYPWYYKVIKFPSLPYLVLFNLSVLPFLILDWIFSFLPFLPLCSPPLPFISQSVSVFCCIFSDPSNVSSPSLCYNWVFKSSFHPFIKPAALGWWGT